MGDDCSCQRRSNRELTNADGHPFECIGNRECIVAVSYMHEKNHARKTLWKYVQNMKKGAAAASLSSEIAPI